MIAVAALGLVLSAPDVQAEESLADKAARVRRPAPAAAVPAKVYTNEDLLNAKGTVIVLPEPPGEPEAVPDAEAAARISQPEPTEEEKRAQAGAALQKQIDQQAEIIRLARKVIDETERELGDITNYTFGTRRAAQMQLVEDARQGMQAAQRAIAELEEQARRQGVRVSVP